MSRGNQRAPVTLNPPFKLLLWINSALCVVCLIMMTWIAATSGDKMPTAKERLFNACEHVFTLTAGAFIGLLGGRAAAPDQVKTR